MTKADSSFYEVKASMIAVMANPKRLEIIDLLSDKEMTVSELADVLGLAQAATSQHLAVMRKAGVVETTKDGNFVHYRLADPKIAAACGVMSQAVVDLLVKQQKKMEPVLAVARRQR